MPFAELSGIQTMTTNKKGTGPERRRWPRLKPENVPFIKGAGLNQGEEVKIVNISSRGILLETTARLRPDSKIMFKLVTTEGVFKIEGTVLRSWVFSLQGEPQYRASVAFSQPFELLNDMAFDLTDQAQGNTSHSGNAEDQKVSIDLQSPSSTAGNETEEDPVTLTIISNDADTPVMS